MKCFVLLAGWLLGATTASAQLAVSMSPARVAGNKAVVKLDFKNAFTERVESARAVCFLADDRGKVIGQSTKWVIEEKNGKGGLIAGATNSYHFVITADKPFATTNLTASVVFTRVVLAGGKVADATKDVEIRQH